MRIGSERVTAPCQTPLVSGRVASRTTPLAYATQRNPQLMVVYSNHTIVTLPAASTASCGFPASTGSTFDESCTIGVQIPFVPWVRVCTSNWRFPVAFARIGVEDPGCRRLAGGADRERQEPQDLIGGIGRRREVVDAPPHPGRGRVAARVHDVARRIQPDHGRRRPRHRSRSLRCSRRRRPARSCRRARMRRPVRDGRPGGVGAHHPSETTRSPRIRWSSARGSARLRPRRRQRGSSRRSTVGRAACIASWTRTFVPSVRSHAANVSPAASDATTELLGVPVAGAIERSCGASHVGVAAAGAANATSSPAASTSGRMTPNTLRA